MTFAEKIHTLRISKKLSQTDLAKKLNVSRRTVYSWENEGRLPQKHSLYEAIASILDCPAEYLFSDSPGIVSDVYEKYGKNGSQTARHLLLDVQSYFASSFIKQEEKDSLMFAIHEAYICARKASTSSWEKLTIKYPD